MTKIPAHMEERKKSQQQSDVVRQLNTRPSWSCGCWFQFHLPASTLSCLTLIASDDVKKPLTHRQKQRVHKRVKKLTNLREKRQLARAKKEKTTSVIEPPKDDLDSNTSDEDKTAGFTDQNNTWLKPVIKSTDDRKKSLKSDGRERKIKVNKNGEEKESYKITKLNDILSDEDLSDSSDAPPGDEFGSVGSDSGLDTDASEGEDELPIEKAAKKLKKQHTEDMKLAEEEMQMNITDQEVFAFPSNEAKQEPLGLNEVQQRIKDVVMVLSDFKRLREQDRPRSEYIELLRDDLCTYYSYNQFLMDRLMELFPVSELLEFLEASEVQRPLTIRANSLKTRRRDLAQWDLSILGIIAIDCGIQLYPMMCKLYLPFLRQSEIAMRVLER
uniref:Uncharacterized protein n=1 Tax=Timema shepardi TaxID=629360 RepID=A0A7R9AYJ6_TIMSH|nr:unnamed protein product [Timema shepardi]